MADSVPILLLEILSDHGCELEQHGVIEVAQIQRSDFLYFIQPVHERVAVNEQLPRGFAAVQVVLKELLDRP